MMKMFKVGKLFNKIFLSNLYLKVFPLRFIRYHSYRIEKFIREVSAGCDIEGKTVLDIGAQNSPYRKYFKKASYLTQDIKQNNEKDIDFIGDICEGISEIKDGSFDYIICTQVLEHLKEPKMAFREFNRILKKEGKVFLTSPLCYEEHMEPVDYYRYTKYGLKYLGESTGFKVIRVSPHGGIFQVIALLFSTLPIKLVFKKGFFYYFYILIFTLPTLAFNFLCYLLDYLDRDKIMTINYECIYLKSTE